MSRAVSNLVIVLVMATTITVVLALSSNTVRFENPADGRTDELAATTTSDEPETSFGDQTVDALKGGAPGGDAETPADPDTTTNAAEAEPASDGAASDEDAAVLGVTQAQETSSAEELAETGPVEISQWLVIAVGVMATGGLARNAGRDHADGLLTLTP